LLRDDEHAFVDPARARFPASPTEWPELDDPRLAARTLRGETWLRGLVPGTYVALPLPDDLAFQPARVVLTEADDGASLELRWRAR
jgi:hypothetical protein